VATDLNNLALLLQKTKPQEAEALYRRALTIDEASYSSDHPDIASDLNNLGSLLLRTNRQGEALTLLRRGILMLLRLSKTCGHLLPNTAAGLRNYGVALIAGGQEPQDARKGIASVMDEAGFDQEELWPHVFGSDD
jgi:tetratricopeptide (TPR) repeat protein